MREADVFLFPTYHKGEGHPNVINEAMANELPIVVTKQGSIEEILDEETAYFIDPRSPTQIADALCHIESHRDERDDAQTGQPVDHPRRNRRVAHEQGVGALRLGEDAIRVQGLEESDLESVSLEQADAGGRVDVVVVGLDRQGTVLGHRSHRTLDRNAWVRWCCGLESTSLGAPCSTTTPPSMKTR